MATEPTKSVIRLADEQELLGLMLLVVKKHGSAMPHLDSQQISALSDLELEIMLKKVRDIARTPPV